MKSKIDQLQEFVRRGQKAQEAIDRAIDVDVSQFPPWKRCELLGCHALTRGAFCPLHRDSDPVEGPAGQGASGQSKEPPRGSSGSVGGAYPARGRTGNGAQGSTHPTGGRKRNARRAQ